MPKDSTMDRAKPKQVLSRFVVDTPVAAGAIVIGAIAGLVLLGRGFGPFVLPR